MPEKIPPEWMWAHTELVNDWFEELRAKEAQENGTDTIDGPATENEDPRLAAYRRR